jgi:hypothetical protein
MLDVTVAAQCHLPSSARIWPNRSSARRKAAWILEVIRTAEAMSRVRSATRVAHGNQGALQGILSAMVALRTPSTVTP